MNESIAKNIAGIKSRIAAAARKAGRDPDAVTLVAVSKNHDREAIRAAVAAGMTDLGESRVQEADAKITTLGHVARWHLIGHLQTNKAARAIQLFDTIDAVDSIHLAEKIDAEAEKEGKRIECLAEINSSGEDSKYGFSPAQARDALAELAGLNHIIWRGIMTIGPYNVDEERIRRAFRQTREIFVESRGLFGERFDTLSMGMSDDFETAIEEGSTQVRIGTAIFGPRAL
jgi:hypothetical protein